MRLRRFLPGVVLLSLSAATCSYLLPLSAQTAVHDDFDGPADEFVIDTGARQRRIQGLIDSVNAAQGSIVVNAVGISYPSGRMRKLDLPQRQVITGSRRTRLYLRGRPDVQVQLNDIKKGDKVIAIATWRESESRWSASELAVWSRKEAGNFVLDSAIEDEEGPAFDEEMEVPYVPENACIAPPAGLVGWWRGEIDTRDYSGTNHGKPEGELDYIPGLVGQAFVFDGEKARVRVPQNAALPVGGAARTVEFWMFTVPESWGTKRPIFDWGAGRERSIFGLAAQEYPFIEFWARGGVSIKFSAAGESSMGWRHIAVTYDGKNSVTAYVNGTRAVQKNIKEPLNTLPTDLIIGGSGQHPWYFPGIIDEFSIYNRALNAREIRNIYESLDGGKCGPGRVETPRRRIEPDLEEEPGEVNPNVRPVLWSNPVRN